MRLRTWLWLALVTALAWRLARPDGANVRPRWLLISSDGRTLPQLERYVQSEAAQPESVAVIVFRPARSCSNPSETCYFLDFHHDQGPPVTEIVQALRRIAHRERAVRLLYHRDDGDLRALGPDFRPWHELSGMAGRSPSHTRAKVESRR